MVKKLTDLPTGELARLDAICLDFESKLRVGDTPSIDDTVAQYGGDHAEVLEDELRAVVAEFNGVSTHSSPFGVRDSPLQEVAESPTGVSDGSSGRDASGDRPEDHSGLPQVGDSIGPYRIDGLLGRGGMGVVYRATDARLDRNVAIKMLSFDGEHGGELTDRFEREAKAVAKISHPNIVELFDVGSHHGSPYAVMELLEGQTLLRRLAGGPMTPEQVRRVGGQIADALAVSHAAGVIHRDVKPHNVMLASRNEVVRNRSQPSRDPDEATVVLPAAELLAGASEQPRSEMSDQEWTVKVFDYGLSRAPRSVGDNGAAVWEAGELADETDDSQTRAGMILGTPGYMSPEQARGEAVSPAADVFGLGCIMHEAFYGRRAFDGRTPADRLAATLNSTPSVDAERRTLDPELADLIERCVQADPAARPAAAEIAEALRVTDSPVSSVSRASLPDRPSTGTPVRQDHAGLSRRRLLEALAGGAAGMMVAGITRWQTNQAISRIRSLGVLTMVQRGGGNVGDSGGPTEGEQLSVSLVNELSQIQDLMVAKFFPLRAEDPEGYRRAAARLQVDALVDGQFRRIGSPGAGPVGLEVDLQLISGQTGKLLYGESLRLEAGDSLVQRKLLAQRLAEVIGHGLDFAAGEVQVRDNQQVYTCINKGLVQTDPDRVSRLQSALGCFKHAVGVDQFYDEPFAAVALASITLAGRVDREAALQHIVESRTHLQKALDINANNERALLAQAMLDWQIDHRYDRAVKTLRKLAERMPNHWQVHQQLGWLLLTLGQDDAAMERLRHAARLARMSQVLQNGVRRAHWFGGSGQLATRAAEEALRQDASDPYSRGLLIDLLEQSLDYGGAAALDSELASAFAGDRLVSARKYLEARGDRLDAIPYGPFGDLSNRMIHRQRLAALPGSTGDPAADLESWRESQSPSLPLLLARHPAFQRMRMTGPAADILPKAEALR